MRELLAYNPDVERKGVTYGTLASGVGTITIDLQELGVNVLAANLANMRNNMANSEPRLFYLNGGQDIKKDNNGIAQTITYYVQAGYAKDSKYQETLLAMEERASEILSVVDKRMTDAQKVAALYNKFTKSTRYVKNNGHWIMTGPLLEGGGICGGYSYAFQYLLQRAGIEAIYTRDVDHAWNYMKVDGEWYFADSTWGTDRWLLKGVSSLSTHKHWQTFATMPQLAENDYDLSKTKFNGAEADATYATVVNVVKEVLEEHVHELDQIDDVYMIEPSTIEFVGNEVEEAVAEEIREGMEGNFTGSLSVVLRDYDSFATVEEFLTEGLTVGYQASDDTPYYYYTPQGLTVYNN